MTGRPRHLGFLPAAERVLEEIGRPIHYREITQQALEKGWIVTQGSTPEATLYAQIAMQMKRKGDESTFVRTDPGVVGLRKWLKDGTLTAEDLEGPKVFTAHYMTYDEVWAVLPVWEGEQRSLITGANSLISTLKGDPPRSRRTGPTRTSGSRSGWRARS